MAVQGLNNLQFSQALDWAGNTFDSHLMRIRANDVQLESDIITQILGQKMNRYGLSSIFNKYPTKMFDTDADYVWKLKGDDEKAVPVISFSSPDLTRPGIGNQEFTLTVAENMFQKTDHLFFDDITYSVRIMNDGQANISGGWSYQVKIMKPSLTAFIPPSLMVASKRVSRFYNSDTNILGKDYNGLQFTSPFEMRNIFSTRSKKYECARNMLNRPMLIGLTAPDGSVSKNWTEYQDLIFEWQWRQEGLRQLLYGEYNQNPQGTYDTLASSGFPVKQGAGLRQQIAPAYQFHYNTFSLDLLKMVGENISINILPEDQRHFVVATGERGMSLFSDAVADKVAIFQPLDSKRVFGEGQNLGFGGQYREYRGYNGVTWTVMHMPEYDNPVHHRLPHPDGGFTENYRMTVFNVGTTDGRPNIQICKPKGADVKWYVGGSCSPYGPTMNGSGSSAVDGYEMFRRETHGIMLRNPLSAVELIPNVVS